jgi:hypothetical protein
MITKAVEFSNTGVTLNVHRVDNVRLNTKNASATFDLIGYVDQAALDGNKNGFTEAQQVTAPVDLGKAIPDQLEAYLQAQPTFPPVRLQPAAPARI